MASVDLAALDEEKLAEWLLERRWFGSKARDDVYDAGGKDPFEMLRES